MTRRRLDQMSLFDRLSVFVEKARWSHPAKRARYLCMHTITDLRASILGELLNRTKRKPVRNE